MNSLAAMMVVRGRHFPSSIVLCAIVAALTGCDRIGQLRDTPDGGEVDGGTPHIADAGQSVDSGLPVDEGSPEAGPTTDGGQIVDGGQAADAGQESDAGEPDAASASQVITFSETTDQVRNPERGFYEVRDLPAVTDPNGVQEPVDFSDFHHAGETLVLAYVRLDDFRDTPIPDAFLAQIQGQFDTMRAAGLSTVLRFAYNRGPYPNTEPDASKSQILAHIVQLTPLLQNNADIIAVVQAGFIGAWGEWDDSTNGLLDTPQDGLDIATALLNVLPTSRAVQFRTPVLKQAMFGGPATGFDGSFSARSGHHNDCFLASDTDEGTYPAGAVDTWLTFVAADTLFVPMGGETCLLNPPRSDCASALSEMARLHYSFLNGVFSPDVIAAWEQQGCYDEIHRSLGYRFIVDRLELPSVVQAGQSFSIQLDLHNDGFAAPFNERPAYLVLTGPQRIEVPLPEDPRTWRDSVSVSAEVTIPADGGGTYSVALWLPDADLGLQPNPNYAIRVPNAEWDPATGLNILGTVSASVP